MPIGPCWAHECHAWKKKSVYEEPIHVPRKGATNFQTNRGLAGYFTETGCFLGGVKVIFPVLPSVKGGRKKFGKVKILRRRADVEQRK